MPNGHQIRCIKDDCSSEITPSGSINICSGQTLVLSANTGTNYYYQWYLNGNEIVGATSSSYTAFTGGGVHCSSIRWFRVFRILKPNDD